MRLVLVLTSILGLAACEELAPQPAASGPTSGEVFAPAPTQFGPDDHVVPLTLDPSRPQPTPTVHSFSRTQERLPPDAP